MQLNVGERQLKRTKQRTSSKRSGGTSTAKSITSAGNKIAEVGARILEKVKTAEKTAEYSSIIAQVKNETSTFYNTRSKDAENYGTLVQDTDDYIDGLKKQYTTGIDDTTQRSRIAVGIDNISTAYHSNAVTESTSLAVANIRAENVTTRASMAQDAAAGDDNYLSSVVLNYAGIQRTLVAAGIYEDDDAEKDILSFATDAVRGKVQRMMNEDLEGAQQYLMDNEATFSRLLDPDQREKLLAQVDRLIGQRDAKEERARKAAEAQEAKDLKIVRDATYQMSFQKIRDGEMTVELLDSYAVTGMLHKTDYDGLYKMYLNRDKDLVGNPEVYRGMLSRAYMGDLSSSEIISSFNSESISMDWVKELSSIVESGSTVTQSDEYKTYLTSLKTALGWAPSMAGFTSPAQSQLLSKAQVEYWKRAQNGENLEIIYSDMLKRYQQTALEIYPKPRFDSVEEAKKNIKPGIMLDRELEAQKIRERLVMQKSPRASDNTDLRN